MAIYHLSVSNVSRASGSKATATLSYISGRRVHDERRGETYDYGRKGARAARRHPAAGGRTGRVRRPRQAVQRGRAARDRPTARPAKKIVVALPREFTPRQRVQALEEYIRENLNADGYAATYAIHDDGRGNNPHAHILVANRQIDPATGGWARLKQRMEYVLDERGERVPLIDPKTGRQKTDKRNRRQWKRTSVSPEPARPEGQAQGPARILGEHLQRATARDRENRPQEPRRPGQRPRTHHPRGIRRQGHRTGRRRQREVPDQPGDQAQQQPADRHPPRTRPDIRPPGRAVRRQDRAAAPTPGAAGSGQTAKLALLRGRRAPPARSRQGRPCGSDPRQAHGREGRREEPRRVVEEPRHRGVRGSQADHRRGAEGLARGQGREHLQARQAAAERRTGGRRAVREAARAVPWLEDADIPSDWDQANRFRMRATKAIHDHDMQPRTRLVAELERRLEQAEQAENEKPSPEQVKALALRMAEQREQAENPTQGMNRPEPSGDEPMDLSEPEDLGESSPFEERSAPRTKADLLREIRQRADRRTGQQEAEQRQIDPWSVQPPQRHGHSR